MVGHVQCGIDHQKPIILLIFGTLSLGGCGGHPMRPKSNLKDLKGQMSEPNEYTDNFKSNLTCIFLSVRAKFKKKYFSLASDTVYKNLYLEMACRKTEWIKCPACFLLRCGWISLSFLTV